MMFKAGKVRVILLKIQNKVTNSVCKKKKKNCFTPKAYSLQPTDRDSKGRSNSMNKFNKIVEFM